MPNWTELHLKPQALTRYGLPDIAYPVRAQVPHSVSADREELPLPELLFGLQERSREGGANWQQMEAVMDCLARHLMPDNQREVISTSGDRWWVEIGPVDLNGKLVTIQRGSSLIAAMAPREDGRLRIAAYRPLDAKSAKYIVNLGLLPHPEHGVCMRENNWEYAVDSSAGIGNVYADSRGEAYLSYWEKGIGISSDGTGVPEWRVQADLIARPAALVATELGVHYILSSDDGGNQTENRQVHQEDVPRHVSTKTMNIAKPTDWKTEPLPSRKTTLRLDRTFSFWDINRIRMGLAPWVMEDKWFIYWKDDTLFFHRSWTGYCIYVVRFSPTTDCYRMVEADVNRDPAQYKETRDESDVEMISYLIDLLLLHQDTTFPSDDPSSDNQALINWSLVGRAMLGQHPNDG